MAFDAGLIGLIREAAAELGHATMDVKSEAGHDSYHMATVCPAAMIFTPCKDGVSHNEAEDTTLEDTLPGANVLLRAVIARANRWRLRQGCACVQRALRAIPPASLRATGSIPDGRN